MKITLSGNPQSTNNIYRSTCRGKFATVYMTAEGKALKESYQWEAKSQWKKKPLETDVCLNVVLYFGDKITRDIDNYNKILLDALTGIVWLDDSQVNELHIFKEYDKKNPRIELLIA